MRTCTSAISRWFAGLAIIIVAVCAIAPCQIIGGKVVTKTQQEDLGLITVVTAFPGKGGVGCSGILLANDWVLTAGHCVDVLEGKTSTVTTAFVAGSHVADAVYKFGGWASDPAGPDVALLHLATPVSIHGATTGFTTRIWTGELAGKTVAVFGTGAGAYLASDFIESSANNRTINYSGGPGGTTTQPGDSGGPGMLLNTGVPYLVGLTSTASSGGTAFAQANVAGNWRWILAVPKSQWFPNRSSSIVSVDLDEINGTPWSFAPANQVTAIPWELAQRAATTLCMNRGMAGGHFEGTQVGTRLNLQCSKRNQVSWQDVSQGQVNATGWGFSDINSVPWAQANRAAERLCASLGGGYSGGLLTGHSLGGKYGLFCFAQGTQWFDSTSATRSSTPIGDLDRTTWYESARAAKAFCVSNGFDSGFFNGQQVTDRKGIVCQR